MKVHALLLVAAGLAGLGGAAAAAEGHVALVKSVSGTVQVTRGEATFPVASGERLQVADRIVSGPASTAALVFKDGTSLTLGPAADIQVRDYVFEPAQTQYAFAVYLAQGSAVYASGKLGRLAPDAVRIDAPSATVGVRGTRFLIEAR